MQINSQNSCNSSYNIRQRHYLYAERERELPNLFQDDLLCASHAVCIIYMYSNYYMQSLLIINFLYIFC